VPPVPCSVVVRRFDGRTYLEGHASDIDYGLWSYAKRLDVHIPGYLLNIFQARVDLLRDIHVEP
jgi:hypothetical protein